MTRGAAPGTALLVLGALPALLLTASGRSPGPGRPGWAGAGGFFGIGSTTASSAATFVGQVSSSSVVSSSTASTAGAVGIVSCSDGTCSVVLGGDVTVQVLGATISLLGIQEDRATLRVDGNDVTCSRGGIASAGAVRLNCTRVGADTVEFIVTLG